MDKKEFLFISDWKKDEGRWLKRGEKGEGRIWIGEGDHPTSIFVDDESLHVSDVNNYHVMKWVTYVQKRINVVAGGNGQSHSWKQLSKPQKMFVDQLSQIYV